MATKRYQFKTALNRTLSVGVGDTVKTIHGTEIVVEEIFVDRDQIGVSGMCPGKPIKQWAHVSEVTKVTHAA